LESDVLIPAKENCSRTESGVEAESVFVRIIVPLYEELGKEIQAFIGLGEEPAKK
jgi:hypothetical protein